MMKTAARNTKHGRSKLLGTEKIFIGEEMQGTSVRQLRDLTWMKAAARNTKHGRSTVLGKEMFSCYI